MLEHAMLLLRRLDSSAVQAVVEPSTYAPARLRTAAAGAAWLESWFAGPLLEVREHEDESLLCTIRNSRLRPGTTVGLRRRRPRRRRGAGRRLEDRNGRIVAMRRPNAERIGDAFLDAKGRSLATLRPGDEGIVITFAEATAEDPFTRHA